MSETQPTSVALPTRVDVPSSSGEPGTAEELLPLVYDELRRLAAHKLAQERSGQTLQATALVHEAWLRLVREEDRKWDNPQHFFCAAATAMRRILIESARRRHCLKHGGHLERVEIATLELAAPMPDEQLLELDEALNELAVLDPPAAQLVNLRFFAGLTEADAAMQLGISRNAVDRLWQFARAWLFSRICPADRPKRDARAGPILNFPEIS